MSGLAAHPPPEKMTALALISSTPSLVSAYTPHASPASFVFSAWPRVFSRGSTPRPFSVASMGSMALVMPPPTPSRHMSTVGVLPSVPP